MKPSTLERIYPKKLDLNDLVINEPLKTHIDRYAFAARHLIPGKILDIACGVGYGTYYLSNSECVSDGIIGVDIDKDAISVANQEYSNVNITYQVGSAYNFLPPFAVSNIISLETIEHLEHPGKFISHASSLLQWGNRFIISVPITPSMDINPFHLHDFTSGSICKLIEKNNFKLINYTIQVQHYKFKNLFNENQSRIKIDLKKLLTFYIKNPSKIVARLLSLIKDGLANKYFIGVFEKY